MQIPLQELCSRVTSARNDLEAMSEEIAHTVFVHIECVRVGVLLGAACDIRTKIHPTPPTPLTLSLLPEPLPALMSLLNFCFFSYYTEFMLNVEDRKYESIKNPLAILPPRSQQS